MYWILILRKKKYLRAGDLKELALKLNGTKIIFLYIPAGPIIDDVVNELSEYLVFFKDKDSIENEK